MGLNDFNPLGQLNGVFAEPTDGDFSKPRRMHHTYVWLGSIRIMLFVLFVGVLSSISSIIQGLEALNDNVGAWAVLVALLGGTIAIFAIVLGIRVLDYRNRSYVLTDTEFNLYSGIITKRHLHVPYQRIQSIDETASLLQRLAGVTTMKIDTAGGAANKAIMMEYMTKETCQALRTELFARKQVLNAGGSIVDGRIIMPGAEAAAPENGAAAAAPVSAAAVAAAMGVDAEPVTYAFGLSTKEVLFASASGNVSVVMIVTGFFTALITALGVMLDGVGSAGLGFVAVLLAIAGCLGSALVMWVIGALTSYLQLGNFSAKRRGTRIEVEQGVLRRYYQGVDIDRVQNVTIKQGLIRRLLGYCEISLGKIEAQGQESGGQKNNVATGVIVHPFVKVDLVPQILAGLVPEFAWVPQPQIVLPPVAKRRVIFRRITWANPVFWVALCAVATQIFVHAVAGNDPYLVPLDIIAAVCYVIYVLYTIPNVISGLLWKKESFLAYDHRGMMVRNGGFNTTTVVLPRTKIQFSTLRQNPFQRRVKVHTLLARTAAGVGGSTIMLRDLAEADAYAWYDWTQPGALRRLAGDQPAPAAPALQGQVAAVPAAPADAVPVVIEVLE